MDNEHYVHLQADGTSRYATMEIEHYIVLQTNGYSRYDTLDAAEKVQKASGGVILPVVDLRPRCTHCYAKFDGPAVLGGTSIYCSIDHARKGVKHAD